ncbi:MAG: hypothetical protein V9G19_08685 [Tetrasphaera sp.]
MTAVAEIRVRHADDGGFQHAGNRVDLGLNLFGIDVVAAGDDQILAAPDDVDIAALVDTAQVAGDEEAVGRAARRRSCPASASSP